MHSSIESSLITWHAVCAKGTESILLNEIKELGGEVLKETPMGAIWQGNLEAADQRP